MKFFDKFKVNLKHKWLDYDRINRDWIVKLTDKNGSWSKTVDGGKRPNSNLILGAITALEPRLADLLYAFCELNSEPNNLAETLGLNFDPDIEIAKQRVELAATEEAEIVPLLTDNDFEYLNKVSKRGEQ
ncbi:hypothetical protein IQ238_12390 [Pleurocapsales cyanobacterium LEGE 06147]|nr:hypothetical protein [Pleurocapsales cyanobacterium LEGE 06147]